MGYDPRQVDAFLSQIGASYASGVDAKRLAATVRNVRFPLVSKGYEPERIDEQLRTLADQLAQAQQSDADVIAGFVAAA